MTAAIAPAEASERWVVDVGDCRAVMRQLPDNCVDAIVTDPPYGMSSDPDIAEVMRHWLAGDAYVHGGGGFMGKTWDSFVPGPEYWRECFRVLKPGGHLLAFAATRTYDLMSIAIRFAGFEVRDMVAWMYGTGFPKSLDVSKAIDKDAGHWRGRSPGPVSENGAMSGPNYERVPKGDPITAAAAAWDGWGTALKPAQEPVCVARKPLDGTVAANVQKWGTGALNIDACRIGDEVVGWGGGGRGTGDSSTWSVENGTCGLQGGDPRPVAGRWPANVILDENAAAELDAQSGTLKSGANPTRRGADGDRIALGAFAGQEACAALRGVDVGGASRFFYVAKASRAERDLGCGHLPPRETKETVDRDPDSAGVQNPRAGAGRGAGAPIYRCSACGLNLGGGRAASACPKGPEHVRELVGHGAAARNHHPTVKPVALMRYLVRLVTPPGGSVLDPFCGSGTTGMAAVAEGFEFMGIEQDPEYAEIARARIAAYERNPPSLLSTALPTKV